MENKSYNIDINGYCKFFLLQLGYCAIILDMFIISNFELPLSLNFEISVPLMIRFIAGICMVLPAIFIIVYAILVIYSFIKRKSYTIQLAMSYLLALFLNANLDLLEITLNYDINTFYLLMCIIGIIWFTIWMMYLYYSKHIDELFPISERVYRKRDYLPIIFIVFPSIVLTLIKFYYI